MSLISLGFFAASATKFEATGGDAIEDYNGFRHHIFFQSGTLTVPQPGKQLFLLTQNGGNAGAPPVGSTSSGPVTGGAGGSSGLVQYRQGTSSSNITVTVGGAGGASSVSGLSLSPWQPSAQASGGSPGALSFLREWWGGIYYTFVNHASDAENGVLHNSRSPIYMDFYGYMYPNSGGGGAGGGAVGFAGDAFEEAYAGQAGFAGGNYASGGFNQAGDGENGSGGGGGGGGIFHYYGEPYSVVLGGQGGSGYTVISYEL